MINVKRFAFIIITVVLILLVTGNWATPAQANNIEAATPMPISTPIVTPIGPDDTVSLEQQEEFKSIIQSYFDIRYQALSVSRSNDFQLNKFGNLTSEKSDARTFLDEELGKLAVEIRHAELNHLRYVDYKYSLDFKNFIINTSTQVATVSVIEDNEVVYEISEELNPQEPIVSHRANLEHIIILRKEQDQWKIVSDNYNDYLWTALRQMGRSTEEILRVTDEMIRSMKALPNTPIQDIENTGAATAYPLSEDSSSHPYDRAGAVNYALQYYEHYNPDYPDYNSGDDALPWGDCTNFVSQAIYEGGNASMYIPSILPPPSVGGQSGWYLLNDMQRATDWNDVGGFYTFVTSEASNEAYGEGPVGQKVNNINELMLGDIIQYERNGDGTWDHAVIVTEIRNGTPYVASHSENYDKVPYTNFDYYENDPDHIRFIHIERSNGNPPVKAEIISANDDAGPNPLFSCSYNQYSNEVYFGTCPNGSSIVSGFQFKNVQIPQGAQMKYAYLKFTVDGPFTVPLNLKIDAETTGNPASFSSSPPGSQNRVLTRVLC